MMKKSVLFLLLLFSISVQGQFLYPAKWTFTAEDKKDGNYELLLKVKLDPNWHIYSQYTPDGGPIPLMFTFDPSGCYSLIGKVLEPKPIEEFDSSFGVNVLMFGKEVTFRQKVKLNGSSCTIKGRIDYQACLESCILLDTVFTFTIGSSQAGTTPVVAVAESNAPVIDTASVVPVKPANSPGTGMVPVSNNDTKLEEGCGTSKGDDSRSVRSFLGIFIAGMLGGLLALLTPCVFPMIPMTVSFFTKRSGSRKKGIANALIYAASIILIYVSLGLIVTVSFGSDALNALSSNAFFNLAFFVIFVIFAISFFGAFEITLPSWIINKADSASDRGGLIGIFFMAFTLSLVSFSCTGPIIGTLLVEAAQGQSYIGPLVGMFGFSFALAVPFALFSLFPGWLNSLPKSGGWLNSVKVSLGFIELALALKFLSNVDLAYHWGILQRELFIAIWVVIFLLMGLYLLGKIRLSHDSELPYVSTARLIFSIIVLTFTLYLIPGIWGAPLKLISGFPPPEFYKEWKTGTEHDCPHNLNCFHDYEEGMRYAKAHGKPVLLDFTGWSCVNCRKMEDKVWSDPAVLKRLMNDYVLISLYVDDKMVLPAEQQFTSPTTGKLIRTTGNKWSDFQASVYQTNSQPYYVLIDNNAKILAEPRGGMISIKDYLVFLDEGLCRYDLRK
jgi:thiol:disulfide interchange protein DsbD